MENKFLKDRVIVSKDGHFTSPIHSPKEVAKHLGIKPATLSRLARERKIGHYRLGKRSIRYGTEHVNTFIENVGIWNGRRYEKYTG